MEPIPTFDVDEHVVVPASQQALDLVTSGVVAYGDLRWADREEVRKLRIDGYWPLGEREDGAHLMWIPHPACQG